MPAELREPRATLSDGRRTARVRRVKPRLNVFGHIHAQQRVVEVDGTRLVGGTTNERERPPVVIDL